MCFLQIYLFFSIIPIFCNPCRKSINKEKTDRFVKQIGTNGQENIRKGTPADADGGRRNDSGPDRQISRQQRREGRGDLRRIQVLEREKAPERTEYSNGLESYRARRND
jgi:hypothetical protein